MSQVYIARSIEEACQMLSQGSRVLCAGATNLYVDRYLGKAKGYDIISIHTLQELKEITHEEDGWHLGSLATFDELENYFKDEELLKVLSFAASLVGGPQVRNRGTIGGNIVSASPSADTLPVLMALDASVVLRSLSGERRMPVADFMTGVKQTAIRANELLTEVIIPDHKGRAFFRKLGKRNALAIAICNLCVYGRSAQSEGGELEEIAIAIGSCAPTCVRARHVEKLLLHRSRPDSEQAFRDLKAEIGEALSLDISPIDDLRATESYRRKVAQNLVCDFLKEVWECNLQKDVREVTE